MLRYRLLVLLLVGILVRLKPRTRSILTDLLIFHYDSMWITDFSELKFGSVVAELFEMKRSLKGDSLKSKFKYDIE